MEIDVEALTEKAEESRLSGVVAVDVGEKRAFEACFVAGRLLELFD